MSRTSGKFTVVIAGTGYGGLSAARALSRAASKVRVVAIDQNPYHLLQYQLPEAAAGKIDAKTLALPQQALLPDNVEFKHASIQNFDFSRRVVRTDRGDVAYDRLIISLGGQPATYDIPGLDAHAFTLKSLRDARRINGHVETTLATAAAITEPDARAAALRFVVGGAGITGVELAAELADSVKDRAREYGIHPGEVCITLLEAAGTVLPGMSRETVAESADALRRLGVEIRVGARVMRVEQDRVVLNTGESIQTHTFIWTGGVRANQLVLDAGLTIEGRGAAVVDPLLRSVDYPYIVIIGDSALVRDPKDGSVALPCAQLAVKQGQFAASDILAELRHDVRHAYVPRLEGLLISLGSRRGVGTIGPVWVRRLVARWGKIGAETRYLWSIGGLRMLIARWLWLRAEWVSLAKRLHSIGPTTGRMAAGAK